MYSSKIISPKIILYMIRDRDSDSLKFDCSMRVNVWILCAM